MENNDMVCVILTAGHACQLSKNIEVPLKWKMSKKHNSRNFHDDDTSGKYEHLHGVPKALLPGPGGKKILDYWWDAIKMRQLFKTVYLVTNADKYKHFERWATASDFPVENIINDGSTVPQNALGSIADFELALRTKDLLKNNVLVIAGDMMFQDHKFNMVQVLEYFHSKADGDLAIYYEMHEKESTSTRGIVEVCPQTHRILRFLEKPTANETSSRYASVVFNLFRSSTLSLIPQYLGQHTQLSDRNFGQFLQWLIGEKKVNVYGMKLPTGFQMIGQVGLNDYESWLTYFTNQAAQECSHQPIRMRAYARVGLMGNPSDGFFGKTISLSIANFWAQATIAESDSLRLIPHPLNDPTEFGSLGDLYGISSREGYLGGLRLLQAVCKKFYHYCSQNGIALAKRNFTLSYDTNIPRQVGLAGSSAIVTAALRCLMAFFNLTDQDIPKNMQPQFILDVEKEELKINAGLQDRVVQIYEGLVYMDFSRELMESQGHGNYSHLVVQDLPSLYLAYLADPSDSGAIHSDVSTRWKRGDSDVQEGMQKFAKLTDEAAVAIQSNDWQKLAELMNDNFNLRRSLYGDAPLGQDNLRMINIGRNAGAAVKFPGSGGAVLGLLTDPNKMSELRELYQAQGCVVVDIIPKYPDLV